MVLQICSFLIFVNVPRDVPCQILHCLIYPLAPFPRNGQNIGLYAEMWNSGKQSFRSPIVHLNLFWITHFPFYNKKINAELFPLPVGSGKAHKIPLCLFSITDAPIKYPRQSNQSAFHSAPLFLMGIAAFLYSSWIYGRRYYKCPIT